MLSTSLENMFYVTAGPALLATPGVSIRLVAMELTTDCGDRVLIDISDRHCCGYTCVDDAYLAVVRPRHSPMPCCKLHRRPHAPPGQRFDGTIAPDCFFVVYESELLRDTHDACARFFSDPRRLGLCVFKDAQGTLVYADHAAVPPGLLLLGWRPEVRSAADLDTMTEEDAIAAAEVLAALDNEVRGEG